MSVEERGTRAARRSWALDANIPRRDAWKGVLTRSLARVPPRQGSFAIQPFPQYHLLAFPAASFSLLMSGKPPEALSTRCGGQGMTVFYGMAKPVKSPQTGPAQPW